MKQTKSPKELAQQIAIEIGGGSKTGVAQVRREVGSNTIFSIVNLLLPEEKQEIDLLQVNILTNEVKIVKTEVGVSNELTELRDLLILIANEIKL